MASVPLHMVRSRRIRFSVNDLRVASMHPLIAYDNDIRHTPFLSARNPRPLLDQVVPLILQIGDLSGSVSLIADRRRQDRAGIGRGVKRILTMCLRKVSRVLRIREGQKIDDIPFMVIRQIMPVCAQIRPAVPADRAGVACDDKLIRVSAQLSTGADVVR